MPGYTFSYSHINTLIGGSEGPIFTDSDAEAYYDALVTANGGDDIDTQTIYGIELDTFKSAINSFYVTTKADSTYNNLSEAYLYVGGTDATHAIDIISATSKQTYIGSPSHNGGGMILDGSTQYSTMNTNASSGSSLHSNHLGKYMDNTNDSFIIGEDSGTAKRLWIRLYDGVTDLEFVSVQNDVSKIIYTDYSSSTLDEVILGSRTTSTRSDLYINGSSVANNTNTNTGVGAPDKPLDIGRWAGSIYAGGNVKYSGFGYGITSTQAATLTTAIKTFNETIGRDYTFTDASASAYWDALSVANGSAVDCPTIYGKTNKSVMEAIDNFCINAKANGYWTKLVKVFPIIGGTDATHAINLIDATSVLTYVGSPSHSGVGMTLDGGVTYADMNTVPSSDLTRDDSHIGIQTKLVTWDFVGLGSRDNSSTEMQIIGSTTLYYGYIGTNFANGGNLSASRDGFHLTSRIAQNDLKLYKDGILSGSSATLDFGALPTSRSSLLGAWNNQGSINYKVDGNVTWGTYGTGLTSTDVSNYNTDIETLQTALGR